MSKKNKTLGAPVASPALSTHAGEDTGAPRKNTPRLRFPEFRDAGAWEEKTLSDCCHLQAGKFVRASDIHENKAADRYPCYGGNGLRGYTKSFTHSGQYPLIGRQGALCGNVNLAKGKFHATEHAVVAAANEGVDTIWLFYKLTKMNLNQYATGQAQPGLSVENLDKLIVTIPEGVKEQQKITDCLSSLDGLIAAESEKLDALKTHKKGLMQRLFPKVAGASSSSGIGEQDAPTTMVPRLRFPEFLDAGAWEEKKLAEIATLYKGKGISKSDIKPDGVQPCVRYGELYTVYSEVIENVISKTDIISSDLFLSCKGDVVIPASGETKIDIATAACVMHENVAFGGDLNVIRSNQNGIFLSYYLNGPLRFAIAKVAQGDTVVHLYKTQLELLDLAIPAKREQQKIADCLSSLDALIAAQAEKLDALKTHKKGLMQRLFPSTEESTQL